jgi:hypothetical protein
MPHLASSRSKNKLALVAVWLLALAGFALLAAAPAGAFIAGEFGVQQRRQVWRRQAPLQYHGGPVIHASDTYVIYWDPLELYNSRWMQLIDGYFRNVGEANGSRENVFALNDQYGETGYATGPTASAAAKEAHAADQTTFRGAYTDTDSYPSSGDCAETAAIACLTDQEIKTELQKVIASGALPGATGTVPGAKSTPVYYLLTPPGVTVCTSASSVSTCSDSGTLEREAAEIDEGEITHSSEAGICGYHSTINPHGSSPIVYAVQPWIAGDAGLFVESESPLTTSGVTADVLACQDDESLEEPNQVDELNPFAAYGSGLADVIVGDLAYEQSDIVVDPLFNGWYQNAPTEEHGSPEQSDMCKFTFEGASAQPTESSTHAGAASDESFGEGSYYIHWGFNSSGYLTGKDTVGCWQGVDLAPHITASNPVKTGDVVGLDANESGITLAAASLNLRLAKEETRMGEELVALGDQKIGLGEDIFKLEQEEAKLAGEIAGFQLEESSLEAEVKQLGKEEQRVAADEAKLAKERKEAEEAGKFTKEKAEEFAATERILTEEQQRTSSHKAAAEKTQKTDEERQLQAERKVRADTELRAVIEEDKRIVEGDKGLAEEEKKLADEHRLIKEREPFIAPIYKWDFGYQAGGKEVTEEGEEKASVLHTFPCAGTYTIGLTVLDGGGFEQDLPEEEVHKTIAVEGKSCESPPSGGGSSGSGGSGSSGSSTPAASAGGSSSTPSTTAKPQLPAPVAAQAVASSSLAKTVKKGLVVRYSVNEQVTGSFNVLLAASIAKRLGLRLPLATGLPAGTPPQEIVGKALLITTKGGHGTIKIEFGKATGARLRKLGKASLMLQLNLRNASGQTTTVLSKITLR